MTPSRILSIEALNDRPTMPAIVVAPTYNERDNIWPFVEQVAAQGVADLLVVDDGSPDGTADEVRHRAGKAPIRLWLMRRSGKLGLGTAYLDAFAWIAKEAASYRVAVEMDADLSHDPARLALLIAAADAHGIGVGSRYVPGGSCPDWPWQRRLLSAFANAYARHILNIRRPGFNVRDVTAGYVAWRRDALEWLARSKIGSNGYSFQIETKFLAFKDGFSLQEIPIVFHDRRHGVSKIDKSVIFESVFLPWKLLFRS